MRITNYNFDVEVVRSGQPRPYADSVYEFIITDNSEQPHPEQTIRAFCESVLAPPRRCGAGLDSTENLTNLRENRWKYQQLMPFAD